MTISNALLFILSLLVFPSGEVQQQNNLLDSEATVLCSGEEELPPGTCYGYANCTACKNCKYCKHCNNGGSCGVCTRMVVPKRKYNPPPKPYTPPKYKKDENNSTFNPPTVKAGIYIVLQSTSMRSRATHESGVLKRFRAGDEVTLLERTNEHWWKVSHGGQVGWIKKALLERK